MSVLTKGCSYASLTSTVSLKCLLRQELLRMSANYTFLIFMLPFLLLSFVSALSSFISCSGNYLTPDVFFVFFFNVLLLQ